MRKRKVIFLTLLTVIFLSMTGCDGNFSDNTVTAIEEYNTGESMFVCIEITKSWLIVYHKETKVMYTVSRMSSGAGHFTLLVNPDGSPMIWEE